MKKDKYNNIEITRGDTEFIDISLIDNKGNFIPFEIGDIVYMTVKEDILQAEFKFQKIVKDFDEGVAHILISPHDTKSLDFKDYIYDVQVTDKNGIISTIVKPAIFRIGGEVTLE